jgi:hypothetical protein
MASLVSRGHVAPVITAIRRFIDGWNDRCQHIATAAGMLSVCFALTNALVNDARDWRGGVDCNTVLRNVFFRLMQSRDNFSFRLSSAPLILRSLVEPPDQCAKVDFKDEDAVE